MRTSAGAMRTLSLRSLLTLAMVVPMILTTAAVGSLAYYQGRRAVTTAVEGIFAQVNGRIDDHLDTFLSAAVTINDINSEAFGSGSLRMSDPQAIESHLIALMRASPGISSTYVGSLAGGLVDAGREGKDGQEYVIETPGFAAGSFVKSAIDVRGRKTSILLALPSFDARTRPWFQTAILKGRETWTDVFSLFSGQDSAISTSRPIYDLEGRLVAVTSVDLFLSQIRDFLVSLDANDPGRSFIIDDDGLLVASPSDSRIFDIPPRGMAPKRIRGDQSGDPLIAAAAVAAFPFKEAAGSRGPISFTFDKAGYLALSSSLEKPAGLGWHIISVFPEAAFTERLGGNQARTILATLSASLAFILLAIFLGGRLASGARSFSAFADTVAEGRWKRGDRTLPASPIREVETLRKDLVSMGERLEDGFSNLRAEIDERGRTEARLRESQHAYDRLARNMPAGIYILRSGRGGRRRFDYVSPRFREIFGIPAGMALTSPDDYIDRILPDDRPSFIEEQNAVSRNTRPFRWEGRVIVRGEERHILMESTPETQPDGDVLWDGVLSDISEARRAGERIKGLLAEKELLLHEVHHRIKNNMNTVASMLAFQAELEEDGRIKDVLNGACERLAGMMLLYDRLYRSDSVATTDAALYLADIASKVASQYGHRRGISIVQDLDSLVLDARELMPIGIIVNELLTNAFKHAFPGDGTGTIRLALKVGEGSARLLVADDGVGGDGQETKHGFGMVLIEGLVQQMGAGVRRVEGAGTGIEISFPLR